MRKRQHQTERERERGREKGELVRERGSSRQRGRERGRKVSWYEKKGAADREREATEREKLTEGGGD